MKKGTIGIIVVIAILVICVIYCFSGYNSLVTSRENIDGQYANIETQLQRRMDLIPNLVNTVKGYATHESEIITQVSEARAKLAGANTTAEQAQADSELSGALSRLLMVVENYPELKANVNFQALMDELAGTENRISVARIDYNQSVKSYNSSIQTFPRVILANIFGFAKYDYFEASEGAEAPPVVDFNA